MKRGLVTILLPSLNARKFLAERVDSLIAQTYGEWEAIVLDSHSTDGTWEYLQGVAAKDPRFILHQIPKDGLYAALNRGIRMAEGEFLHIATCDDTMEPTFLEETVAALVSATDVEIAATDVRFISNAGETLPGDPFGDGSVLSSAPERMDHLNIRPIPHDAFLHLRGQTLYFSLTQLVVATQLAKKVAFDETCGSIADFEWSLVLTGMSPTIHIPRKLATWRFHGNQLSFVPGNASESAVREACQRFVSNYTGPRMDVLKDFGLAAEVGFGGVRYPRFSLRWFGQNLTLIPRVGLKVARLSIMHPLRSMSFMLKRNFELKTRNTWLVCYLLHVRGFSPLAHTLNK